MLLILLLMLLLLLLKIAHPSAQHNLRSMRWNAMIEPPYFSTRFETDKRDMMLMMMRRGGDITIHVVVIVVGDYVKCVMWEFSIDLVEVNRRWWRRSSNNLLCHCYPFICHLIFWAVPSVVRHQSQLLRTNDVYLGDIICYIVRSTTQARRCYDEWCWRSLAIMVRCMPITDQHGLCMVHFQFF